MSTDDLMTRVRDHLAHADTLPHGLAIALVSELADEVDRLTRALHMYVGLVDGRRAERDAARGELARTEEQIHEDGGFIDRIVDLEAERDATRAALGRGDASDGYHTHNELYEYRMLYNAHAAHGWLAAGIPVVKSWKHSDGEPCFGGGWFIVVATLPTGQVSNHYKAEHWGLFHVPEVDLPPEYDGHTPADASNRLRTALEAPRQG